MNEEVKRQQENAEKAIILAEELFPNEKWILVEDGIYVSSRRPIGKNSNYAAELRDAQILRDVGNVVYLVPDNTRSAGRKYDAIVSGEIFEFKNIGGNENTLVTQFLRSRSQAPNVFMNLETSNISRKEVLKALHNAINSVTRTDQNGNIIKGYEEKNKFKGGKIIIKLNGDKTLILLNVDDCKRH
jgi:hypothetical protein